MNRIIAISILCLTTTACQVDDEVVDELLQPGPSVMAELPDELGPNVEVAEDVPTFSLARGGGASLSFFVAEDGSVGMLEEIPLDSGVGSVLDHPLLRDASPAMVYHAITNDGSEMPDELYIHHEDLAAAGELAPLEEALAGQERGWAATMSSTENPCTNAVFDAAHCANPEYDEELCFFNASGNLTWNVPGPDRYKAGFCLQEGSARSWLYYRQQYPDCFYGYGHNYVWGAESHLLGDEYNAPTYANYIWWRASGGLRRLFYHNAIGGAGAVYDFGNRYTMGEGGCP